MKWIAFLLFSLFSVSSFAMCNGDLHNEKSLEQLQEDYLIISEALVDYGFKPLPVPLHVKDPASWQLKDIDLQVDDPTKSHAAKYVFDVKNRNSRIKFVATNKAPKNVEHILEWKHGNGTVLQNVAYIHLPTILYPEEFLNVIRHEGTHVENYERCLKSQSFADCAKKIAFIALEESFEGLPKDYDVTFMADEWEAFLHELEPGTGGARRAFRTVQKAIVDAAVEHLEQSRRSSAYIPAEFRYHYEIPVAEFKFRYKGRKVLAVVPYFMPTSRNHSASIDYLVRTFRSRQLDLL